MKLPTKDTQYEIGMEVILSRRNISVVRTVGRLTDKYFGLKGDKDALYRKVDGRLRGADDWTTFRVSLPEGNDIQELRDAAVKRKRFQSVREFATHILNGKFSEDAMEEIYAVITNIDSNKLVRFV